MKKHHLISITLTALVVTALYFITKKNPDLSTIKYDLPDETKELAREKQYFNKEQKKKISQLLSSTIKVSKAAQVGLNMQSTLSDLRLDLENIKAERPKDLKRASIELEAIKYKIELHNDQMKKIDKNEINYSTSYGYFDEIKKGIDKVITKSGLSYDQLNSLLKKLPESKQKTSYSTAPIIMPKFDVPERKTTFNNLSIINEAHAELPIGCQTTYQATPTSENYQALAYLNINDPLVKPNAEILELSRKLGTPIAMYKYIRDNIKYYPTFGFTQNAETVLSTQKANPYDQSTLLISLLRSAGIPARYVVGEIWITESKLRKIWDIEDKNDVWNFYYNVLNKRFNDNVGIKNDKLYKIIKGEFYFLVPHSWVETYASTENSGEKKWIQLDPAFVLYEKNIKYPLIEKIFEISSDLNLNVFSYEDFFFAPDPVTGKIIKRETADLFAARKINGILNYSQTNNYKWDNNFTKFFQPTAIDLTQQNDLPFGPLGEEACIFDKSAIPDSQYFPKLKFSFADTSITVPMVSIASKKVNIRYRGYNSGDQSNLNLLSRGQYYGSTYYIKLIAQLYIDDSLIKESSTPLSFGQYSGGVKVDYLDTNGMWIPDLKDWGPAGGGVWAYDNSMVPVSQAVFDFEIQKFNDEITKIDINSLSYQDKSRLVGTLLSTGAIRLKIEGDDHEKNIGEMFRGKVLNPALSYYFWSGFNPITFNDRNYGFSPDLPTLSIDGIWTIVGGGISDETMGKVAYAFGSQQEHQIMENHYSVPGRSSVFILQYAKEHGIPIVSTSYNPQNIDSVLGQLIGYGTYMIDYYRQEMLKTKTGYIYAPKYPVKIDGITYRVVFGSFGALIGAEKGGSGGLASEDTGAGYSLTDIKNDYTSMGGNLNPDSRQISPLINGDSNAGQCSSKGKPVNLNNGGMWHKFSDISPMGSGTGIKTSFSRNYLSKESNELGVLGYGWTHNMNLYLQAYDKSLLDITKNQDIFYFDGDGNKNLITFENNSVVILPFRNITYKKENGNFILTDSDFNVMTFYGSGNLVGKISKISDRNGNTLTFSYNDQTKLLSSVRDIDGRTLNFNYLNAQIIKVTDFTGRSISFSYDGNKDLTESIDLLGNKTAYTYYSGLTPIELNHNLKSFKNEKAEGVEYFYYKNDKVFRHIESEGKITTFIYDTYNKQTHVINGNKERTVFRYDILGSIVSIENPDHTLKDYKYDLFKNKIYEKDENNFVTTYKSDSRGNIIEINPPAPFGKTFISYDPKYNLANKVTDPKGNITLYEINPANGNILSIKQTPTAGKELITRMSYNERGDITSVIDPKQSFLTIAKTTNSDKSQRITLTNAEGGVQVRELDPLGHVISSKDLNGIESTFVYNNLGNIVSSSIPMAEITQSFEYDKSNNLINVERNANGKTLSTTYKRDGLGNIVEATNEKGETFKISYKQAGCLCTDSSKAEEIIDPKGNITKLEHDWRGNVTHQIDPMGVKTKMNYDPRGNLADVIVFNRDESVSSKISFAYGALNRLSERLEVVGLATVLNRNTFKGSDPAKDVIVKTLFSYDSVGNLIEKAVSRPATGEIAKINYSYNGLNKIIGISSIGYKHNISKSLSYDDNSNLSELIQNNLKLGFQYDKTNRPIIAETFADSTGVVKVPAFALNYSYTLGGQIKSIKNTAGIELVGFEYDSLFNPNLVRSGKYSIGMEFDALGRKKRITYPNKLETTFTFDGVDRLAEISTPGVGSRSFDYDEVSNINQVKFESGQFDYAYDQNSALIGAYYKGGEGVKDEKFVWDASGNRMNGTRDPASNAIRPRPILTNNGLFEDAEPMPTNGVGRYSFIYDMHGNVVKKYDNQENIYYVFEYDADNKLVYAEKYVNDSLELKAKYFYDGLGRRVEKEVTKGSTVTRKSYVYNGDNILVEYNTSGATPVETAKYIGTGAIDDNLMTIRSGKGYFYHKDHLGSVSAISNDAGEVIQKNQYSAFGKIVSIKDKERRELGLAKALEQPFYYTGREWDDEVELYYYRARSYDPSLGRFLTFDPIGLNGGDTNLYRYVKNNPVNFVDPLGLYDYPFGTYASTLNTDQGIQMVIDSYVSEARNNPIGGANVYQAAHGNAQDYRNAAGDNSLALSSAEHYLWARGETQAGGTTQAVAQSVSTTIYTPAKSLLEITPNQLLPQSALDYKNSMSPASTTQMKWGYKGVYDGGSCPN